MAARAASVGATVSETLAMQPLLVGVSISDPLVAPLLLAFVRLLRQRGFAGHITAGGALATLERGNLLAAHPAIDSVVRHAGEACVVELAMGVGGRMDGQRVDAAQADERIDLDLGRHVGRRERHAGAVVELK